MKTKLIKQIRNKYHIYWNSVTQKWHIYTYVGDIKNSIYYQHEHLDWILYRAFEDLFKSKKSERLKDKLWNRSLCKANRISHRNKVLKRKV